MRIPHLAPAKLRATLVTLALSAAGGAAFAALGLPAPWLSGGMIAVALALVARVDLYLPQRLRDATMLVLGLSMGSGVSPATLADIGRWPGSLVMLFVVIVAIMAASVVVARRWGWDAQTAVYAAAPGALQTVLMLAYAANADMRRVVVAQSARLFVIVAMLPTIIVLIQPDAALGAVGTRLPDHAGLLQGLWEWPAIIGAGLAGALFFWWIGAPAGLLLGAFLGSAVVHGSGLVAAFVPYPVLVPCFVVLGAFIALRFSGTTLAALKADLGASLVIFVVASAIAVAGAVAVSRTLGLPLADVLVAFAPGGLEAMSIMAFALKLDVAYVSTHHLARFVGIALLLPIAVRFLFPGAKPGPGEPPP